MSGGELALILVGWSIGLLSPGPANLAIAGTAMASGRMPALALAAGVITGGAIWGIAAAVGLAALMSAAVWPMEVIRYLGAACLLWLAWKSMRAATRSTLPSIPAHSAGSLRMAYLKGLLLHLANPKPVLFWGAMFSVVVSPASPGRDVLLVLVSCLGLSIVIFLGFAAVFSRPGAQAAYRRARRWVEGAFALVFGAAGLTILTKRLA